MGVLLLASGTTELSVCMRMSLSTIIVGSREHLGRCQCGRRGERQSAEDPGIDSPWSGAWRTCGSQLMIATE